MINQIKTALFSVLRNTEPCQKLSAYSNKAASVFKQYVPIDSVGEKITFCKTAQKVLQEHKRVVENAEANMSTAVTKDLMRIKKLSVLIANDIIIQCFPLQGLNSLFTKFYNKKQEGFADFLLEKNNLIERTSCPEYRERQITLWKLSSFLEQLFQNTLTSNEYTLFKGPLIMPLSSHQGAPLDFLAKVGVENGRIPQSLYLVANYEKGSLTATLKAKSELSNTTTFSVPVPNIANIGERTAKHFQEYKTNAVYHNSLYAKIVKRLKL